MVRHGIGELSLYLKENNCSSRLNRRNVGAIFKVGQYIEVDPCTTETLINRKHLPHRGATIIRNKLWRGCYSPETRAEFQGQDNWCNQQTQNVTSASISTRRSSVFRRIPDSPGASDGLQRTSKDYLKTVIEFRSCGLRAAATSSPSLSHGFSDTW